MKLFPLLSLSAFLSFGINLPARAQANHNPFMGAPTRYSVDVVTVEKAGTSLAMRMYVDGNKRRTEQETKNGQLVLILRGDTNVVYTIIVSHKVYRVRPLDPTLLKSLNSYALATDMILSQEKAGTETVNWQFCDKYRFSSAKGKTDSSGTSDGATSGFIWISQSTHLPVKSQTERAVTQWENLDVGPQDPSLYEPPAGFQQTQ